MILLLTILAFASGEVRRCALPYLTDGIKHSQPVASVGAPREAASNLKSYKTAHFAFWWTLDAGSVHRISGSPANVLPGDSIPEMVRVASTQLESAWKTYVDTLGYLPPLSYSQSYLWNQADPGGRYLVEFCDVGTAIGETGSYFGVAYPMGIEGRSLLLLAANLLNFDGSKYGCTGSVGWCLDRDIDGKQIQVSYSTQWREATMATCAHELYHAVQFNYERAVAAHGFFEASAVAMESRLVPQSGDYMQFSKTAATLDKLEGFPTGIRDAAYAQAWFVRSMMNDLGLDVLRGLWESRKATLNVSPSFLSTLRQILPNYRDSSGRTGSFEAELARQTLRLGLTGKRSTWHPPGLWTFPDAGQFPTLTGVLTPVDSYDSLALDLGQVQVQIDTARPSEDRIQVWIPDEGVQMGRAWRDPSGAHIAWYDGSVRWAAKDSAHSIWGFANPGNPVALRASSRDESSVSYRRSMAAPVRTPAHTGQKLTWTSPDGLELTGTSLTEAMVTPLLHLDIWRPSSTKDPFASTVVSGTESHSVVLEDADRLLTLSGASLRWSGHGFGNAYMGSGDGGWIPATVSALDGAGVVEIGDLDLSHPIRILIGSGSPPSAASQPPRPNPSRKGAAISFPIAGATGKETLDIFSVDGGLICELHPVAGAQQVSWDLTNREGRKVRPAVYWYRWSGVTGTKRGQLLVAE